MVTGGWATQGGSGYPMGPLPAPVLADLGIYDAAIHDFSATLQVVVAAGVGETLLTLSLSAPSVRFAPLLLLHLRFE